MLARDTYLNSSCGRNRSLIFKIKNRCNASERHYMETKKWLKLRPKVHIKKKKKELRQIPILSKVI